jgi:glycerol-3-phosphate acyltransferase PlsY
MEFLSTVAPMAGAYLLGAVPFGLIVARLAGIADIRSHGSGNIGATNVWRVAGPKVAVWVYVLDIGKGAVAVLIAQSIEQRLVPNDVFVICCAGAAILGHVYPIYLRFRGGKGVSTALGAMLILLPVEVAVSVAVFMITVLTSRYVSLGSILAAVTLSLVVLLETATAWKHVPAAYIGASLMVTAFVIYTHRQNIRRLKDGTENRFSLSPRTGSDCRG